ncbi:Plant Tudor-like protein [Forsythia ovata]|uniref:Plant Tudor-like protein n=1 Tax=Forsythia ovata TaxID=205694 RepID=A0ABD1R4Q7_9LAMI
MSGGKKLKFQRGDQVEIASKEEGFVGSYYEARVVTELARKEYIVQYLTLVKDDMSEPLREVVTADEVRPPPPEMPVTGFRLYDLVDAFDNDGWWVGKITGRIGNKYFVYFDSSKDELAYDFELLRMHQDLVDGKWVFPKNQLRIV